MMSISSVLVFIFWFRCLFRIKFTEAKTFCLLSSDHHSSWLIELIFHTFQNRANDQNEMNIEMKFNDVIAFVIYALN